MTSNHPVNSFELRGERDKLARLVGRIQTLTLELQEARRYRPDSAEVDAKRRTLDQLRWRLAAVARRTATDGRGGGRLHLVARSIRSPGINGLLRSA